MGKQTNGMIRPRVSFFAKQASAHPPLLYMFPAQLLTLPPQLAALMQTNINVQSLTVETALTRKREHIYHAAMLDPHTGAGLSFDQIYPMVDELIAAHGSYLPEYH